MKLSQAIGRRLQSGGPFGQRTPGNATTSGRGARHRGMAVQSKEPFGSNHNAGVTPLRGGFGGSYPPRPISARRADVPRYTIGPFGKTFSVPSAPLARDLRYKP